MRAGTTLRCFAIIIPTIVRTRKIQLLPRIEAGVGASFYRNLRDGVYASRACPADLSPSGLSTLETGRGRAQRAHQELQRRLDMTRRI